jgi:hypothetical protein
VSCYHFFFVSWQLRGMKITAQFCSLNNKVAKANYKMRSKFYLPSLQVNEISRVLQHWNSLSMRSQWCEKMLLRLSQALSSPHLQWFFSSSIPNDFPEASRLVTNGHKNGHKWSQKWSQMVTECKWGESERKK